MNIIRAQVVLTTHGADHVSLYTALPTPTPGFCEEPLVLSFAAGRDTGADYVRKNFGIEPQIVQRPVNTYRFGRQQYDSSSQFCGLQ